MIETGSVSEAFAKIALLGAALGVSKINTMPACWEVQIDERWWLAINGHKEDMECSTGDKVPPFHAYIRYNGWPAGMIYPGGGIIAAGECANENTFIAAIEERIAMEDRQITCERCDTVTRQRDLLDGEACPHCWLIL